MELKYCWRCKIDVPMLNMEEHSIASRLYKKGINSPNEDRKERFKELLDYYYDLTGFKEIEPNAILHHAIQLYGPDCERCEKPYRTPDAKWCAACGNQREVTE